MRMESNSTRLADGTTTKVAYIVESQDVHSRDAIAKLCFKILIMCRRQTVGLPAQLNSAGV